MICTKCKKDLPEEMFFWRLKGKNRRHEQCKSCYKEYRKGVYTKHYKEHRKDYLYRAKIRNKRVREENRKKLIEYLLSHPCIDCGEKDIIVLEFDHKNSKEKEKNIAYMARFNNWEKVLKEIEKCDVRCANCHRKRTAKQNNWYKNNY